MRLRLDYNQVDTGTDPKIAVIWMHGLGDHGSSFVPLVQYLDLEGVAPVRFIFPHAPERPVTVNSGFEMRAWYDIYGGFDDAREEDSEGVRESKELINRLIEAEKERGVPTEKIFLAGFSQGSAMAIYTGLCYPEKLGGVIGLSGYVPLIREFPEDRNPANQQTPVFLGHGAHDEVVPFSRGKDSCELLKKLGYDVQWHEYQITHTLSMEELEDISAWLKKQIA